MTGNIQSGGPIPPDLQVIPAETREVKDGKCEGRKASLSTPEGSEMTEKLRRSSEGILKPVPDEHSHSPHPLTKRPTSPVPLSQSPDSSPEMKKTAKKTSDLKAQRTLGINAHVISAPNSPKSSPQVNRKKNDPSDFLKQAGALAKKTEKGLQDKVKDMRGVLDNLMQKQIPDEKKLFPGLDSKYGKVNALFVLPAYEQLCTNIGINRENLFPMIMVANACSDKGMKFDKLLDKMLADKKFSSDDIKDMCLGMLDYVEKAFFQECKELMESSSVKACMMELNNVEKAIENNISETEQIGLNFKSAEPINIKIQIGETEEIFTLKEGIELKDFKAVAREVTGYNILMTHQERDINQTFEGQIPSELPKNEQTRATIIKEVMKKASDLVKENNPERTEKLEELRKQIDRAENELKSASNRNPRLSELVDQRVSLNSQEQSLKHELKILNALASQLTKKGLKKEDVGKLVEDLQKTYNKNATQFQKNNDKLSSEKAKKSKSPMFSPTELANKNFIDEQIKYVLKNLTPESLGNGFINDDPNK